MPDLAVNDRRVSVLGVPPDILPHVQDGAAGRVDERRPAAVEAGEHRHRDAEGRKNHHVLRPQRLDAAGFVAEESDAHRAELFVDVRVVDDFAGEIDRPIGEALARLVRVVDRPVDAVAESELAREVNGEAARAVHEIVGLDLLDERAVIAVGEQASHGLLQVQSFAKDQRRQDLTVGL